MVRATYRRAFWVIYNEVAEATGAALVPFLLEGMATDRELMQRDGIHSTAQAQTRLLDEHGMPAPLMDGLE